MSARQYHLVESFGEIIRMTTTQYARYLRAGIEDTDVNPRTFGVSLGIIKFFDTDAPSRVYREEYERLVAQQHDLTE